ncbi:MAG: MBL fold metallo-hydrolase [Firmicutes bacterium]|nr:MBL fold metallo-hydrolase [Bacillota bacterium]MDH7495977.1 MBL fold metallo-hydrolase [Bacillota bacterium]
MVEKIVLLGAAIVSAACLLAGAARARAASGGELKVRWFGHACFLITTSSGVRILTDPFDATVGYPLPQVEADVVTSSHDHFDHNNVKVARGNPVVLKGGGRWEKAGGRIYSVASFHDTEGGAKRGPNGIFVVEADGIRLVHMGDIGHDLSKQQLSEIGRVDVLLVPVGGTYTIDAAGAKRLVEATSPKVVIPMHYKTPVVGFPIATVDKFVASFANVTRLDTNEVGFRASSLPESTAVYVLNYE